MASRLLLSSRLRSALSPLFLRSTSHLHLHPPPPMASSSPLHLLLRREFATSSTRRHRSVDIGARARQLQNRRLWTYALTFSCVAGFIVIVLSNFQDQLVFYITPTDALARFNSNPSRNRFRLGGLVLEGSVSHPSSSSPEMEFVVTDLITDMLVKYEGSLPDLFREGHSVVVEGFVRPFDEEIRKGAGSKASEKARSGECFFKATEVLAKHDEKYMPKEVAEALERNKKKMEETHTDAQT
ncbi:cytochrome c-type biogenesis protein CcmE homolog, mitochondrial [Typha angustifolia]|uniref:cytochrome c-type biogenesis protein CcmE homolog, mitochondrial n=1 Tax=Typha angustifolia TaxID=59011 RepID=UPI003C2B4279